MQLREIHIDGFGIFCNRRVTGLSSGTNVLFGSNEYGKSTLLAFIRRILFGFRTSSNVNPYPTICGGAYGGRLVCELANGKIVTISRKEGRSGGPVKISIDSAELSGQEELNKILGQITEKFYGNVYAIGLDELQAVRTLEEEEIKNHIYGAGLQMGNTSLKENKDTFLKQAEAIFKPSGSVQRMPALYKDIREKEKAIGDKKKHLSEFDELVMQRDRDQKTLVSVNAEISKLQHDQRRLEAQESLFPTYISLKDAKTKLAETAETPLFVDNALTKLEQLETAISNLEKQIATEIAELKGLELERDRLVYDDRIIGVELSIISLQKM